MCVVDAIQIVVDRGGCHLPRSEGKETGGPSLWLQSCWPKDTQAEMPLQPKGIFFIFTEGTFTFWVDTPERPPTPTPKIPLPVSPPHKKGHQSALL